MQFKLEDIEYQRQAVQSVVGLFTGQPKNTFDSACEEGVRANVLNLPLSSLFENRTSVLRGNGISDETAVASDELDFCVEMETGTGKTLVYLKTIYELFKEYGFTKFIILVPSVAIKEGVLSAFQAFETQLEELYGFSPSCFEYDSKRLSRVTSFVEDQHPQIMVMTLQSFNSEDRILNQAQRENLFQNIPFIESIAQTRPIIFMDEPQEGMDTKNAVERIGALNPLFKLRYSATHKVMKNLIYRLTPYDSYRQGMVKKIEVLTVTEQNEEATLKLELTEAKTFDDGRPPQAKLRAWCLKKNGTSEFKETPFLKEGADLEKTTGNIIYRGYVIRRIFKPLRAAQFQCEFENGALLTEKEKSTDIAGVFGEQLYWLIDSHFTKRETLRKKEIKCLSLIFIDRVDNYMKEDGIIRRLFVEKYRQVFQERFGKTPDDAQVTAAQGYYFCQTAKGEFTDSERAMAGNKELFDLILRDKQALLSFDNPVEFIFSHSALGTGWDNPNVFNIATLNQTFSEVKKRQEIGRGLRICVNQTGERVYDSEDCKEGEEINLLTVVPNETYQTFVTQYQSEIKEIYGTAEAGARTRHKVKGKRRTRKIRRNEKVFESDSFKAFWRRLSRTTDYRVVFNEDELIRRAADALNAIHIEAYGAEISLTRIKEMTEKGVSSEHLGSERRKLRAVFGSLDLVEELSEGTSLAYPTVVHILREAFKNLKTLEAATANPPRFVQEACARIREIELDEMLRGLEYTPQAETFDLALFDPSIETSGDTVDTPRRCLYDRIICDSSIERDFAGSADNDDEVVCFLKLPPLYKIPTPIGPYNPDFGVVLRRKRIREGEAEEFYFVVETKGTESADDKKSLRESEMLKIRCAMKHFDALGVDAKIHYEAPIKQYSTFKQRAGGKMHE